MKYTTSLLLAALCGTFTVDTTTAQDTTQCVENLADGWVLYIPMLPLGTDPRWVATDGSFFVERADGTATLTGAVYHLPDPCRRYSITIDFTGRVNPGDAAYPPANNPYTTPFVDANLVSVGGTIDTNTWHYYTASTGTMTGRLCLDGAVVNLVGAGAAFQVGFGANLASLNDGCSGWFVATVAQQPTNETLPAQFAFDGFASLGDSCPCFGGTVASWSNYGLGLAGCAGIPTLELTADPLTGSTVDVFVGNTGPTSSNGVLLWSHAMGSQTLPFLGAPLLLANPLLEATPFLTMNGTAIVKMVPIPDDSCLIGSTFFGQALIADTCAAQGWSMTPGLQLTVGDL